MTTGQSPGSGPGAAGAADGAPSQQPFCALVVDDEELFALGLKRELQRAGVGCDLAHSGREALHRVEGRRYQAILLDHHLPDDDGLRLIPLLLARQHGTSLVMMTAYQTIPNAVEAIRLGADDYVVKETSLQPLVERVLEIKRRQAARAQAGGMQEQQGQAPLFRSQAMAAVVEQLDQAARSPETTVLLTGETGAGKEVACRYLHTRSRPPDSPLVAVDCLALPENLAESLLFGHEKGAFTGADQARAGAFEEARDGTVFLDEIGDMSLALQGKLLRVLESRTMRRVGATRDTPVRARVVAATNRDLKALVDAGSFRLDLFQRLAVFPVHLPPLRERGDDVLLLAEHFRQWFASKLGRTIEPLSESVAERLMAYDYPGNVRELKNVLERAVICAEGGRIEVKHLPQRLLEAGSRRAEPAEPLPFDFVPGVDTLSSLEQRMIKQAIKRAGGVRAEAARLLGISRYQLLRRMEKHGISVDGSDDDEDG